MTDFDSLREDLHALNEATTNYAGAVNQHVLATNEQVRRLWEDNAELRDELHALANRVEALTRARLTEPAEVAERMTFICRLNPGCNVSRPHIHHADGAVIYVPDEATADDQLRQRAEVARIMDRRQT